MIEPENVGTQCEQRQVATSSRRFVCKFEQIFSPFQRLPNGPSSILGDADIDRQREGEIERQRSELGQLKERLALMCRQVATSDATQPPGAHKSWGGR